MLVLQAMLRDLPHYIVPFATTDLIFRKPEVCMSLLVWISLIIAVFGALSQVVAGVFSAT